MSCDSFHKIKRSVPFKLTATIDVKAIVLLHTMQIAFFELPLTCLTHLYSSIVNHLGLKLHFPWILQRNQRQRNVSTP